MIKRNCALTETPFEIEQRDLDFYKRVSPVFAGEKQSIALPTLCPAARQQRRMAWRGKDYFFRNCDKTGRQCLSIFPATAKMTAYSEEAFRSDDWNGLEWGRDFDFSRPFFEQFFELWAETPKEIANAFFCENCEYIINAHQNKNCYLVDEIDRCRDCLYGYNIQDCTNVVNSFYVRKSELCYHVSQAENCYEVFYGHNVHNCSSSAFIRDCRGSHHCLFCTNQRNAAFRIFNKPVTKEEFTAAWKEVFCGRRRVILESTRKFETFSKTQPVRASIQVNCENCTGDQISNSKDCFDCFNIDNCRDCRYCTDIHNSKDAYDVHIYEGEIMYECLHAGPTGYAQYFSHLPWFSSNVFYCSQLLSCHNVFGCSGLKHQEYCVLNKKYSKQDYEALVVRIIEHMRRTGEWGEFFPARFSPYAYQQTMADYYFPLETNEIKTFGFNSLEENSTPSARGERLPPSSLTQVSDSICREVYESEISGKKFKIILPELEFHRKHQIPLPTITPAERIREFVAKNSRKLHERTCAKTGVRIHTTHGADTELVYCEEAYQNEI